MPLLLDNEPFSLSEADIAKYSVDMVYRVGLQFIKPTSDRDNARPFDIGKPHISAEYNHAVLTENGTRKLMGRLIYCEAYTDNPEGHNRKKITTPPYIDIGESGVKQVSGYNYELNYFLDNHPQNEVVKNTSTHPNSNPKGETIFSTYLAEKVSEKRMERHEVLADVIQHLITRHPDKTYVIGHSDLKAIAMNVIDIANEKQLSVAELINYDNVEEKVLRERLCAVASKYPFEVNEAMKMQSTDFLSYIHDWKESGTIDIMGDQWIHNKGKQKEAICKIPEGKEAVSVLAAYLQDRDEKGRMFKAIKASHDKYKMAMADSK